MRFPLTLISAAAGSGKTTILSEWVTRANCSVAWISLESDDNDPAQFLTYFIFAIRTIKKEFGEEVLEILPSSQSDAFEMLLISLINEVTEFSDDFAIISMTIMK